jgi:hypothetical protein
LVHGLFRRLQFAAPQRVGVKRRQSLPCDRVRLTPVPDAGEIGRVLQSASLFQCINAFRTGRQSPRLFERRDSRRFKVERCARVTYWLNHPCISTAACNCCPLTAGDGTTGRPVRPNNTGTKSTDFPRLDVRVSCFVLHDSDVLARENLNKTKTSKGWKSCGQPLGGRPREHRLI